MARLRAALVDIGGTLWPNVMPSEPSEVRLARLRALRPTLPWDTSDLADRLVAAVLAATDDDLLEQRCDDAAGACLRELDSECDVELARSVRRALSAPAFERFEALPGALEFLQRVTSAVGRVIVVSNTSFRDEHVYMQDFEAFGWREYIAGCITSVDVGYFKPHAAMFEKALEIAGVEASEAVMVGNSETADIAPAKAVGMRTILVWPDQAAPTRTAATAGTSDLIEAAAIIEDWASA